MLKSVNPIIFRFDSFFYNFTLFSFDLEVSQIHVYFYGFLKVSEKISYWAFITTETYFLKKHGGFLLGKFHKPYLWKVNKNLRHFYVKWELRKVEKNNWNGKIYIWFCLECSMFSDFHFVYCTVFGFISLFLHFFLQLWFPSFHIVF